MTKTKTKTKTKPTRAARKGPTKALKDDSIVRAFERSRIATKKAETSGVTPSKYEMEQPDRREIYVEVVDLTPDLAAQFLEQTPTRQRKLRPALADKYASDMLAGRWRKTGDLIRLTKDFELIDGQHRCAACVKAGLTLRDQVIEVLYDERAFEALDQQAPRSLKDIVQMSGGVKAEPTVYSAIIYEHLDFKPRRLSKPEQLEVINKFPARDMETVKRFCSTRVTTAGMLAAAIKCMRVDRDDAIKFFSAVFENKPMINDTFEPNAHLLANWVMQNKREKRIGKSAEGYKRECAYRCIQAWNAWRSGRELKRLQYRPNDPMVEAL